MAAGIIRPSVAQSLLGVRAFPSMLGQVIMAALKTAEVRIPVFPRPSPPSHHDGKSATNAGLQPAQEYSYPLYFQQIRTGSTNLVDTIVLLPA
jgi:hypothetical protein